jgi:hypothetical protein
VCILDGEVWLWLCGMVGERRRRWNRLAATTSDNATSESLKMAVLAVLGSWQRWPPDIALGGAYGVVYEKRSLVAKLLPKR